VAAERTVGAPADKVYGVLADYRQHHPNILPPAFADYAVKQGGTGAGTVVVFAVKTAGRRRHLQ
jgi:hypothetical protein